MGVDPDAAFTDSEGGSESGLDYPEYFNTSNTDNVPESISSINGSFLQRDILDNATRLVGNSHTTRTVQMHGRIKPNLNPQYGSFFSEYDPMTGARTAAILGSFLMLLVIYIVYKAKCHQEWTEEDDYYLQQYKQRQQNKAMRQQMAARKSVHYVIDPVCMNPDPKILSATAQWVKFQPLEDAVPAPLPGERRKKRCPLSKIPSISAENINWQMLNNSLPPIPNENSPRHDPLRSCNEYVPNGHLKTIEKDNLQDSGWLHNETEGRDTPLNIDDLCMEYECLSKGPNSPYKDEPLRSPSDSEDDFINIDIKPENELSSLDWHNNNNCRDCLLTMAKTHRSEICSDCLCEHECKGHSNVPHIPEHLCYHPIRHNHPHHHRERATLISPHFTDISLGSRRQRSRFRTKPKQRSIETGSSLGSSSQQQSLDDDSPEFCVSGMPARDAAPGSLDINDMSSNDNTSEQGASRSTNIPNIALVNVAFNSTFSTVSTATASSNGSYISDGPDIPLTDVPSLSSTGTTAVIIQHPQNSVVGSTEKAHESSSKPHEEMDTKL